MIYEILTAVSIGFAAGYFVGRENTIKLCRRLYNLNTNLNAVFAEHTERDKIFVSIFNEQQESKAIVFRGVKG